MKFKVNKEAVIVIAVVIAALAIGIGIMCSGEKEDIRTIQVPSEMVDTVTADTL